jgi:hypothetical protein
VLHMFALWGEDVMFLYSSDQRYGFQCITEHKPRSYLAYIGNLNADCLNIFPRVSGLQYR